jgi:hypothetical protein
VLDTGEKGENFMKSEKAKYTDDKGEMAGELVPIKDFLPPPDEPVGSVTVTCTEMHSHSSNAKRAAVTPATSELFATWFARTRGVIVRRKISF